MGSRLAFGAEREFAGAISVLNATMARHKVIAVINMPPPRKVGCLYSLQDGDNGIRKE
jgi:hypothetical protein